MTRWIAALLLMLTSAAQATLLPPQEWMSVTLADGSALDIRTLAVVDGARSQALILAETRTGATVTEINGHWFTVREDDNGLWAVDHAVEGEGELPVPVVAVPEVRLSAASVSFSSAVSLAAAAERQPFRYTAGTDFDQHLLVVRVAFADQAFTYSDDDIAQRFFGSSDSVQAYFLENSYGKFRVLPAAESSGTANDGVVRITLNSAHPDFGNSYSGSSQALAREVLAQVGAGLDLSAYDQNQDGWLDPNELGLVIMVAGYEQAYGGAATTHPRVWAHKASTYQGSVGNELFSEYALFGERHQSHLATIGVICHELGHLLFDLPDLYDTSGSGLGIGRWGLMGLGGWNRDSGYAGERPAHLLGWSKQQAGFIDPQELKAGVNELELRAVSDAGDVVEVNLDAYRHGERLLLEHRHQSGYDAGLPGSGVLVTRINDLAGFGSLSASATDLRLLAIEEADGRDDLLSNSNLGEASDVFSSASGQLLFSAAADAAGGNSVELLAVEAGVVADLSVELASVPSGNNLGLDELPANAVYGSYGGSAQLRVLLAADNLLSADGIDFYALGSGTVLVDLSADGQRLLSGQSFSVQKGWNRLLWSNPLNLTGARNLQLDITSSAGGSYAPFAVDAQGDASGQTYLVNGSATAVAAFDASVRLLVQQTGNSSAAVVDKSVSQGASSSDSASSASSADSSSGSGGFFNPLWLLTLAAFAGSRRRAA
ncbi:M6 family metalloprotease domain-containing protein [Thalassolituus sp. LLYu03]|uniref:M6 family metalloprotease domain-containing protein n=1 Tax=Thalassolituus sp. LLYu03 TaxID=3421656 RepID=UPI003D270737